MVLLSVLLLTLALLFALHLLYPLERSFWDSNLGGRQLSDDLIPAHYYLVDPSELAEIRDTWDDYVLAGHWQVHPWTGLINRKYVSRHLNVDAEGYRRTLAPSAAHTGLPSFDIWTFGGSTLFGWGLPDGSTIPSQLQVALQQQIPGRQVRVINFGAPWYNSAHAVALLVANLRSKTEPPDVVVFLGGSNDLIHSVHYHSESPLSQQLSGAWEDRLGAMFAPPPWIRVMPSLPLSRVVRALGSPAEPTLGGLRNTAQGKTARQWLEQAARSYLLNHRIATTLAGEFGARAYFFLGPAPQWLDESRTKTLNRAYHAFAEIVMRRDNQRFHDLRGALAGLSPARSMTVEKVGSHYSDAAAQVLAKAMAKTISAVLQEASSEELETQ